MIDHQTRVADAAVGAGWLGWLISHAAEAAPLIQDTAGLCAIIATLVAIRYHLAKTKYIKSLEKRDEL